MTQTYCKDCGVETKPGSGSTRCPDCWDDRFADWAKEGSDEEENEE